jgi:homoserine dehydrogenase
MINVGVIGFGTVGSGTVKILLENKDVLKERLGFEINLKKIATRSVNKVKGIKVSDDMVTSDVSALLDDPDIHIVAELVGGIAPAKDFILQAISKGKHVVTANKALLATEGKEIFKAAQKAGIEIGFEASVAGGIPIIKVIREGLIANRIHAVYGIINGTSNYILTKMTEENVEFSDALKEAQKLGFAEADPTMDIEGIDSAHKLAILAFLSYGISIPFEDISVEGISQIETQDIEFASELGYKVKLLAIAKASNSEIELRVHPTMLPNDYLIAKVEGAFNAIYVEGDATGSTLYYGRGAGDLPTGSAVVSDIVSIARNIVKNASGRLPFMPSTPSDISI